MQNDPYDQFASGYVGMGNDPVNNVDEDGGWSAGLTGAALGAAIGFVAPYAIEAITGKHIDNKGLLGLGGAFLGAGVGYGIGASSSGGGSFLNEIKAFYKGLVDPNSAGSFLGEGRGSVACWTGSIKAEVPNLWGWIGSIAGWGDEIVKGVVQHADVFASTVDYLNRSTSDYLLNRIDLGSVTEIAPNPGDIRGIRQPMSGTRQTFQDVGIVPVPSGPTGSTKLPTKLELLTGGTDLTTLKGSSAQIDIRTSKTTATIRNNAAGGTSSEAVTNSNVQPTRYRVSGRWKVDGTFKKFKILGIPLFKKRVA